jgi:hypothetical protein
MKNSPKSVISPRSRWFLYCMLLVLITGCNRSLALKVESDVPMPLVSKIPITMGVYYDDAFRNYTYREDTPDRKNWVIESGASQVALFNQVLPSMFREVRQLETPPAAGSSANGAKAVLAPVIEEMQFSLPQETRLDMYEVWIKYRIRLLEADGDVITEWPLTAYGKTETEFMKNREQGLNGAMELALRDAGAKLALGFPEAVEVKEWLAGKLEECTGQPEKTC